MILKLMTPDQNIAELCKQYWAVDGEGNFTTRVSDLSRQFGIPLNQIPKLVGQHSHAFIPEDGCSLCNAPYLFSNRSEFQERARYRFPWKCNACRSKEEQLRAEQAQVEEQRRREMVRTNYIGKSAGPFDPLELKFDSAVYLLAFSRLCAAEDFSFARSVESVKRRLSPTSSMDAEMMKWLHEEGLIRVAHESPLDAFAGENAQQFYLFKVLWKLPFGWQSANPKDFVCELEDLISGGREKWPEEWRNVEGPLWQKVARHECLQYLEHVLQEHNLPFRAGEKTSLVIDTLLRSFSVAQIQNFMWRAVKDAAAFQTRESVSRQHAANTVIGAIQRQGERAKAEGWVVKPYGRHWECPQSVVSELFFNVVIRVGDVGFYQPPGKGANETTGLTL